MLGGEEVGHLIRVCLVERRWVTFKGVLGREEVGHLIRECLVGRRSYK